MGQLLHLVQQIFTTPPNMTIKDQCANFMFPSSGGTHSTIKPEFVGKILIKY